MRKLLFFVMTIIFFGTMIFTSDKSTTKTTDQAKKEKQNQQTTQTTQTQQNKKSTSTVPPTKQTTTPSANTTQSTPSSRANSNIQTAKDSKTTSTTPATQTTQDPQSTKTAKITPPAQTTQTAQATPAKKDKPKKRPAQKQTQPAQPVEPVEQTTTAVQPIQPAQDVPANPPAQEQPITPIETNLGKIYISRDFVHADKDYKKGNYYISLYEKEGTPWFKVFNNNKELLFEELAVVKKYEAKVKRMKVRVRKEFLKDFEYFRVMVIQPDAHLMLYFMIKQKEVPATLPTPAENPGEKKIEEL